MMTGERQKNRSIIRNALAFLLGILVSFVTFQTIIAFKGKEDAGLSGVLTREYMLPEYLRQVYSNKQKKGLKIELTRNVTLTNLHNYEQGALKKWYNANNTTGFKLDDRGICWAAAQTSVIKFYGVMARPEILCRDIINKAVAMGYYDEYKGFDVETAPLVMEAIFNKYSIKKEAELERYDIYAKLEKEADKGRAVLFKITGHEMGGGGYRRYKITWNGNSKGEVQKFVVCTDTWSNDYRDGQYLQFSWYPEREIGTGLFSRWNFGIVRVVDK